LERLAPLPARPGYGSHRPAFARLFANFAADSPVAFEALRGLLRSEVPTGGTANDNWYARHYHTNALCQALRGLMALREKAVPAVPDAIPLVAHESGEVCLAALDFFALVGAPAAAPALCNALASANEVVRVKAAEALARQGAPTDDTLIALAVAVEDRAAKVRRAAVDTLNKLGTSSPSVLAALEAATEDADAKVKERAGVAFRKLTPKAEKPAAPKAKGKKKPW
jgi:HEAT repeat protein